MNLNDPGPLAARDISMPTGGPAHGALYSLKFNCNLVMNESRPVNTSCVCVCLCEITCATKSHSKDSRSILHVGISGQTKSKALVGPFNGWSTRVLLWRRRLAPLIHVTRISWKRWFESSQSSNIHSCSHPKATQKVTKVLRRLNSMGGLFRGVGAASENTVTPTLATRLMDFMTSEACLY